MDAYEATLPEVFPEIAPGSFTWSAELGAWVWTTFHTYQWDLDYANPDVLCEMVDVVLDLANVGADVRPPRRHRVHLEAARHDVPEPAGGAPAGPAAARRRRASPRPAVVLQAEAIVGPDRPGRRTSGAHRPHRPECQLAYHNQLMVDVWRCARRRVDAALRHGGADGVAAGARRGGVDTYLRCHDDIGWAIDDRVAASLGLDGPAHRAYLAAFYRGDVPALVGPGVPFSTNPADGDERTCGMAAALCGITAALDGDDATALDLAVDRLLLGYSIVFAFGGIPLIYMGDEVALGNDEAYVTDPLHAATTRVGCTVRRWTGRAVARADVAGTVEHRVRTGLARLVRRACTSTPAMSGGGATWLHQVPASSVLAWERRHPVHGRFYGVANVAATPVSLPGVVLSWAGLEEPVEVLGAGAVVAGGELRLPPQTAGWFVDAYDAGVHPPTVVVRASPDQEEIHEVVAVPRGVPVGCGDVEPPDRRLAGSGGARTCGTGSAGCRERSPTAAWPVTPATTSG